MAPWLLEAATGSNMTLRGPRAEGSCQGHQAGPSRSAIPAVPTRTRGALCSSVRAVASSRRCFSVLTSSLRPWTSPFRVCTLSSSSFLMLSQAWSVYCCVSTFKDLGGCSVAHPQDGGPGRPPFEPAHMPADRSFQPFHVPSEPVPYGPLPFPASYRPAWQQSSPSGPD